MRPLWMPDSAIWLLAFWHKFNGEKTIGGLPVLINNARLLTGNNPVDVNLHANPDWFVAAWFDTGTNERKTYTLTKAPFVSDGGGNAYLRFYNDKAGNSVDNWSISGSGTRTLTSAGRFIAVSVYKPNAADFYIHDDTNNRFVCKGSNVR